MNNDPKELSELEELTLEINPDIKLALSALDRNKVYIIKYQADYIPRDVLVGIGKKILKTVSDLGISAVFLPYSEDNVVNIFELEKKASDINSNDREELKDYFHEKASDPRLFDYCEHCVRSGKGFSMECAQCVHGKISLL